MSYHSCKECDSLTGKKSGAAPTVGRTHRNEIADAVRDIPGEIFFDVHGGLLHIDHVTRADDDAVVFAFQDAVDFTFDARFTADQSEFCGRSSLCTMEANAVKPALGEMICFFADSMKDSDSTASFSHFRCQVRRR